MPTKIEWATHTWSPVTGCTPISEGCANCWAKRMANRLRGRCGYPADDPFRVTFHPNRLDEPSRWRKPRRVFVCSMGDLFHKDVHGNDINQIWNIAFNLPQHTWIFLTKRPLYALRWTQIAARAKHWPMEDIWPSWMWLGVTAENQQRADERIPILLDIPAAVRFVSVEPMLSAVDLSAYMGRAFDGMDTEEEYTYNAGIDWVICGGETGPGARPMKPEWARDLCDQCQMPGVPFFFKKIGEYYKMYADTMESMPRQYPKGN